MHLYISIFVSRGFFAVNWHNGIIIADAGSRGASAQRGGAGRGRTINFDDDDMEEPFQISQPQAVGE